MKKCPYCTNDIKDGFLEYDGRKSLIWVEENQKRNLIDRMIDGKCIVVENMNMWGKAEISACYCEDCKKLIIDVVDRG